MLGQDHNQSQAALARAAAAILLDTIGPDELAIILQDANARAQLIASFTNAHAEDAAQKNSKPQLFKTEMCRFWEEHGVCRRSNCWFAHGKHELRIAERHPKYKTKVCEAFSKNGRCSYGQRCVYIHPRYSNGNRASKINAIIDANQTSINASDGDLPELTELYSSMWKDAALSFTNLHLDEEQNSQESEKMQQIAGAYMQSAAQQAVTIPSTPSNRSREAMACPMSASPDSIVSSSSTMVMTPTTAVSHSPASSCGGGNHRSLPSWRIDAKPLPQLKFKGFGEPASHQAIAKTKSSPQLSKGKEQEEDVFYSPKGFEKQSEHQLWHLTPRSSSGNSLPHDDIFTIE